jgi:hypothetical protein
MRILLGSFDRNIGEPAPSGRDCFPSGPESAVVSHESDTKQAVIQWSRPSVKSSSFKPIRLAASENGAGAIRVLGGESLSDHAAEECPTTTAEGMAR